jgi:2'-5' RNA ligase
VRGAARRALRRGYLSLRRRAPLSGRLLDAPPIVQLRERLARTMDADDVLEIVRTLAGRGITVWLAGGWGVDALLGEQTRRHADLDLCVDAVEERHALDVLHGLGFEVVDELAEAGRWLPRRIIARDLLGRTIDLLSVEQSDRGDVARDDEPVRLEADGVTIGRVADQEIPCLSAALQVRLHSGYQPRPIDREDVERLCQRYSVPLPPAYRYPSRVSSTPASAVVIPVPAAAGIVGRWSASEDTPPAHITVLSPFIPVGELDKATIAALGEVVSAQPRFSFRLEGLGRFPGVLYLAPEPADPFAQLTTAVWRRWPEMPPYGGAFEEIVPHLTVVEGRLADDIEDELKPLLPITASASEVWVIGPDPRGGWRTLARCPLG